MVFTARKDGKEAWVASARSARNMSWQELTPVEDKVEVLATVRGEELFGFPLAAPLASYKQVYALPMLAIKGPLFHFLPWDGKERRRELQRTRGRAW